MPRPKLQERRGKRKKVPVGKRQPLAHSCATNEIWSMAFVFDRSAYWRGIKRLTTVDDAPHESVAVVPERAISGLAHSRGFSPGLLASRGLMLRVIRTDNGKEFCGRAMLAWAHTHQVILTLIEPGKSNQNDCIEAPNGRQHDECLYDHCFLSLAHAQTLMEARRRRYNEERPKKTLGVLTAGTYARQSARKSAAVTTGL